MQKKIAAINDLSGLGKCSLYADISIASAMGIEVCSLPSAILTSQTGYRDYCCTDFTYQISTYTEKWSNLGLSFQGILSGFLASSDAADEVCEFLERFHSKETLYLCDPVLGDNGNCFFTFGERQTAAMRKLAARADILTPNLTEFCLLYQASYEELLRQTAGDTEALAQELLSIYRHARSAEAVSATDDRSSKDKAQTVIVTGIPSLNRNTGEKEMVNLILNQTGIIGRSSTRRHGAKKSEQGTSYSGTGDLFAAIVLCDLLRGRKIEDAVRLATVFLSRSVADTVREKTDRNGGIHFETHLSMLLPESVPPTAPMDLP